LVSEREPYCLENRLNNCEVNVDDGGGGGDDDEIIIIIIIYCNWVVTRWQWLFCMYTKYEIGYY